MKDFFYKNNDIIIVLLILVAAAYLIYDRVNLIMDYPQQAAAQNMKQIVQQQEPDDATNAEGANSTDEATQPTEQTSEPATE